MAKEKKNRKSSGYADYIRFERRLEMLPPVQLSTKVLARSYTNFFRRIAARFRAEEHLNKWWSPSLQHQAGEKIISAHRAGLLDIPGLATLIKQHTMADANDPQPAPGGPFAVLIRCPENLFLDIVGHKCVEFLTAPADTAATSYKGGEVVQLADGRAAVIPLGFPPGALVGLDEQGRVRLSGKTHWKGLLTSANPDLTSYKESERYATCCEMIADLIEEASGKTEKRADSKTDKLPQDPDVLRLAKEIKRKRGSGQTPTDTAREFTESNERKAQSLLRELRRFPWLIE